MKIINLELNKLLRKTAAFLTAVSLMAVSSLSAAALPREKAELEFQGIGNTSELIDSINYADMRSAQAVTRDAVYRLGALGFMKAYKGDSFMPARYVTREEALAAMYIAAGREAEAKRAGETLELTRPQDERKLQPEEVWYDGFLMLAVNEGIISAADLNAALQPDQSELEPEDFNRKGYIEKQEAASWLVRILELEPVYSQNRIFNNFNDWRQADVEKIPYIETALQNRFFNGNGTGSFNPRNPINREQLAIILSNAEPVLLQRHGYTRYTGTLEDINVTRFKDKGGDREITSFEVRNSNGGLHLLKASAMKSAGWSPVNEQTGSINSEEQQDFIVYRDGVLGNSSLLRKGDRLEYTADAEGSIKYIKVLSSSLNTQYVAAKFESLDTANRTISLQPLFEMDYPTIEQTGNSVDFDTENLEEIYKYSSNVLVLIDGAKAKITELEPGTDIILTISNNIITSITTFELPRDGERGVVSGIVEDNNPQLGYIALYSEKGNDPLTGINYGRGLRLYNYGNQNMVEVYKNHQPAGLESVEPGDTVFLRLDGDGQVISVSAVDNYTVKYAKVLQRTYRSISVRYENGDQQVLQADEATVVISGGRVVPFTRIKDGDNVKLLLHITPQFTRIKEIMVEGGHHIISNIYKTTIVNIDKTSKRIIAENMEVLNNGRWDRTETKGIKGILLAEDSVLYYDDKPLDLNAFNRYYRYSEAYIAVEKDYGGVERAVAVSLRKALDAEDEPYRDDITGSNTGNGTFTIQSSDRNIRYGAGTIIVKDGRLVTGNSLAVSDTAIVIANRSFDDGEYYAGIIQIADKASDGLLDVYRGRISDINGTSSFTVESFSRLNGLEWEYANTPKTFKLTPGTRIFDENGLIGSRDFKDSGAGSFKNRTVYIVAKGSEAVTISTAPYGTTNFRAELIETTGAVYGEEGTLLVEPNGLRTDEAAVFRKPDYMWVNTGELALEIAPNTLIIKNGSVIKASELKKGDKLRIIKKDESLSGDALIIFVEEN